MSGLKLFDLLLQSFYTFFVYRSYYSSAGCAGKVAQYDIVTNVCSLYDYPIGGYGTFECDALGELMMLISISR